MRAAIWGAALWGCSGKDGGDDDTATDTETSQPDDYDGGQYRIRTFTILPSDKGADLDGDGEIDNKLPTLLSTFDPFLSDFELEREALNALIAKQIASDSLIVLQEASYDDALLIDFLSGEVDEFTDEIRVNDDASYGNDGEPLSRLAGDFVTVDAYEVGPDDISIPIPLEVGQPPIPFPVEQVEITGDLDDLETDGLIVGMVPVDRFLDEVLTELIPPKGYDLNGNGDIDSSETQKAIIDGLVGPLLNTGADLVTPDKRPAISAAMEFSSTELAF